MILKSLIQLLSILKNSKKGDVAISTMMKVLLAIIGFAILLGLLVLWQSKTNSNVDKIPDFVGGLG